MLYEDLEIYLLKDVESHPFFCCFQERIEIMESLLEATDKKDEESFDKAINACKNYISKYPNFVSYIRYLIHKVLYIRPHLSFSYDSSFELKLRRYDAQMVLMDLNSFKDEFLLSNQTNKETFLDILRADDFDEFIQYLVKNPTHDVSKPIEDFDIFYDKISNSNPINHYKFACLYGSVKCYKYFLNNNIKIPSDVTKYAIIGGNYEIIHILSQRNITFDSMFSIALQYQRNDIADWLLLHYQCEGVTIYDCLEWWNEKGFLYLLLNDFNDLSYTLATSLLNACSHGNISLVDCLLNNFNINQYINIEGRNILHIASEHSHLDIIKYLIEERQYNMDLQDQSKNTALHIACKKNAYYAVTYLCKIGANMNLINEKGYNILMISSKKGYLNIINFLLQTHKIDINFQNSKGWTALAIAVRENNGEIIDYLIGNGADINLVPDKYTTFNLLHIATEYQCFDAVKYFVENKYFDINSVEGDNWTPLNIASYSDNLQIFEYLYEHGANIYHKNSESNNSLNIASYNNCLDIILYIIEKVPKLINSIDDEGFNALEYASLRGQLSLVQFLCEHGAKVRTSLHLAVKSNHYRVVKYLVEVKHAGINATDHNSSTVISYATEKGDLNLFKYLLDHGANPKIVNSKGMNCLHIASANNSLEIVRYIIEHHIILMDSPSKEGYNSLEIAIHKRSHSVAQYLINKCGIQLCIKNAISNNKYEIMKYLVEKMHVDINKLDNDEKTPLHYAIECGNLQFVKFLCDNGANLNYVDRNHQNYLHISVKSFSIAIIQYFVEIQHFDVNVEDINHRTPLYYALINGNLPFVEYLFEHGTRINNNHENILQIAIKNNYREIIQYLVETQHFDTNVEDEDKITPAMYSIIKGDLYLFNYLSQHGANINFSKDQYYDIFYLAIINGTYETVQYLIDEKHININKPFKKPTKGFISLYNKTKETNYYNNTEISYYNNTPLIIASRKGFIMIVELLSENGANLYYTSKDSYNCLHWASLCGHTEIVKYLVGVHNMDVNKLTSKKESALLIAAMKGHFGIVEYLCDHGANLELLNKNRESALYIASRNGNLEIVKCLCDHGANVNRTYSKGFNCLHIACQNKQFNVICYFIEEQLIDINETTKDLSSPLLLAVSKGDIGIVNYLIQKGANINQRNDFNENCLHIAAKHCKKEVIQYFIEYLHFDINSTADGNWTALDFVTNYNLTNIEESSTEIYLKSRGAVLNRPKTHKFLKYMINDIWDDCWESFLFCWILQMIIFSFVYFTILYFI